MNQQPWNDHQRVESLIVNVSRGHEADTYCGRPGPWGNPFRVDRNTSREEAVRQHQDWLNQRIRAGQVTPSQLVALTRAPDGSDLTVGCHCVPRLCHCHTLVRYSLAARVSHQHLAAVMAEPTVRWHEKSEEARNLPRENAPAETVPTQAPMTLESPNQPSLPAVMGGVEITPAPARAILTPQNNPHSFVAGYDYTINPSQGCAAACDYCYAAAYTGNEELTRRWGLWVKVKTNAADLLRREAHLLDGARIYMATATDPYQPVERHSSVTGSLLDVMARHRPLLVIQTRFPLVVRDTDRFKAIVANGGRVQVNVTVTTDDDDLRRVMEPRCPSIPARLRALSNLTDAGIAACATVTPMLPVHDPRSFAERLKETGIDRVIIQGFHRSEGSGDQFRRSTRPAALQWMHENWGSGWRVPYNRNYQAVLSALQETFPEHTGIGQQGFAPPF